MTKIFKKQFTKSLFAQGSTEYLLMIAIIVVIGLVVVSLALSTAQSGTEITAKANTFGSQTSGSNVKVVNAGLVENSTNGVIELQNNSTETMRIMEMTIENNPLSTLTYDQELEAGEKMLFSVTDAQNYCVCPVGEKTTTCAVKVKYDLVGIIAEQVINTTIDCAVGLNPDSVVSLVTTSEDGSLEKPILIENCSELEAVGSNLNLNYSLSNSLECFGMSGWNYISDTYFTDNGYSGSLNKGVYSIISLISDCSGLQSIDSHLDWDYALDGNVDCTGVDFIPIGYETAVGFEGVFDGRDFSILNLSMNNPNGYTAYLGVFAYSDVNSIIKDLFLVNVSIVGGDGGYIGGLVSETAGLVSNVCVSGSVSGIGYVGGITGSNRGIILDSSFVGSLSTSMGNYCGGLVASNDGLIENSWANSTINLAVSSLRIGGLVGANYAGGEINNSYALGEVTLPNGISAEHYGGLVGENWGGSVSNSYSNFSFSSGWAAVDYVGGLIGYSRGGSVTNSYALSFMGGNYALGGLVGGAYAGMSIQNNYVSGDMCVLAPLIGDDDGSITDSNNFRICD